LLRFCARNLLLRPSVFVAGKAWNASILSAKAPTASSSHATLQRRVSPLRHMPISEMSVPEPLCEYCAKIPLDPQTLSAMTHGTEWNLGSGLRVKESGCPFCKLVELTVFERGKLEAFPPIALAEMPTVSVQWHSMGGQGNRGAFLVGHNDDYGHTICFGCDTNQGAASEDCYLRSFLEPKLDFEMVSA